MKSHNAPVLLANPYPKALLLHWVKVVDGLLAQYFASKTIYYTEKNEYNNFKIFKIPSSFVRKYEV